MARTATTSRDDQERRGSSQLLEMLRERCGPHHSEKATVRGGFKDVTTLADTFQFE